MKKSIIFICNGNIERSVIAAQCLNNLLEKKQLTAKYKADSFGLQGTKNTPNPLYKKLSQYPKEYKAAYPTLKKLKIDISKHTYKKITLSAISYATTIIAMDKKVYSSAKNSLLKQFPFAKNKLHIFSEITLNHKNIKDPHGNGNSKIHEQVIQQIQVAINKNYKKILSL